MLFEFKNLDPVENDGLDRSYNTDHIWSVTPSKNDREKLTIFFTNIRPLTFYFKSEEDRDNAIKGLREIMGYKII